MPRRKPTPAPVKQVYVLRACTGAYSDFEDWCVGIFSTLEKAEERLDRIRKWSNRAHPAYRRRQERWLDQDDASCPEDNSCPYDGRLLSSESLGPRADYHTVHYYILEETLDPPLPKG